MPEALVDLRSDTVTKPTAAMRRAMAEAEVGDDAYGEDPTVAALEEAYAQRVGKPSALFVPSGTMANQLALRVLAQRGTSVVAGRRQHIVVHENAAAGTNAWIQFHTVDDSDGFVDPEDVIWAIEAASHHWPTPSLVCVENTHMPSGGVPWTVDGLDALAAVCGDVPVHMDGARLFNAEMATGISASAYASKATTVMSCLSKGLAAPVGSLLAGPAEVIAAARAERQRLGGGMRQAGILAAAGLVALDSMVERLEEDHVRAARLAEAVADRWPGCLGPKPQPTNMVVFSHPDAHGLVRRLAASGVLAGTIAPGTVRLVTHLDVDDRGLEHARRTIASV